MLEILYRDRHLVALNKPANVSLLADRSGAPSLWDALPDTLGAKPYLVHRLDKGTSGVLLIALDPDTQRRLTRLFQQRRVRKYYLCWVVGRFPGGTTRTVDLPLRKGRKSRYRVAGPRERIRETARGWTLAAPDEGGLPSITRLRRLCVLDGRSLLVAAPRTGRTHQIRVHLAWIGHPIIGDPLYGRPSDAAQQGQRLMLHCHRLVVPEVGSLHAPVPAEWLR